MVPLPESNPINAAPLLHFPYCAPQANGLNPPLLPEQTWISTGIHHGIQQTERVCLRIVVRDTIVRFPRPLSCSPSLGSEEDVVQLVERRLLPFVGGESQLAPGDVVLQELSSSQNQEQSERQNENQTESRLRTKLRT